MPKRKVTGRALLGAAMLGLAEAIEGKPREEPAIAEVGDGDDDDPIDVDLADHPTAGVVHIRPWLRL